MSDQSPDPQATPEEVAQEDGKTAEANAAKNPAAEPTVEGSAPADTEPPLRASTPFPDTQPGLKTDLGSGSGNAGDQAAQQQDDVAEGSVAGTEPNGDEVDGLTADAAFGAVVVERDQYLDSLRRLQAEFENYKKQVQKREVFAKDRANDQLVSELLTVLDAFDGALGAGELGLEPMRKSLLDSLGKFGLERIEPQDCPFDPALHEAVTHDPTEVEGGPKVAEVMRAGYVLNGKVLRPAMVQVRG